jgi:hypothetical protein
LERRVSILLLDVSNGEEDSPIGRKYPLSLRIAALSLPDHNGPETPPNAPFRTPPALNVLIGT